MAPKCWLCLTLALWASDICRATATDLTLVAAGQAKGRIVVADHASEVERFAAEELRHYLAAMTATEALPAGVSLPIVPESAAGPDGPCDVLVGRPATFRSLAKLCDDRQLFPDGASIVADGYRLKTVSRATGGAVVLAANEERGVLFAAYQLLEKLGVRFYGYRDRDGEIVPHGDSIAVPPLEVTEKPAFRYRFVSDNNFSGAEKAKVVAVADWAAKNRCNIFMLAPSRAGESWDQIALDEIRKRGLMIAGPGHILARITPDRNLFATHPEYFPLLKGERVANYSDAWDGVPSFCWSNEAAMQLVVANAMRYLDAAHFIDLFAVYPPDGSQRGAQCQCPQCAQRSMSDWYLTLINRIARECATKHPATKVMWISYNECGVPPVHEAPWDHGRNMALLWCNDLRDFHAPFDSEINRHPASYLALKPRLIPIKTDGRKNPGDADLAAWSRWQGWSAYLRRNGYAGDVILLDYYNAHVGHSLHVPMLQYCQSGPWPDDIMPHDFQTYLREGIRGWQNCTDYFNDAPNPWWNWLSAQLLWNPQADTTALAADFHRHLYGAAGNQMQGYFAELWHELALDETRQQRLESLHKLRRRLADAEASLKSNGNPSVAKRIKMAIDFHERAEKKVNEAE
jgi:hypothetical protein